MKIEYKTFFPYMSHWAGFHFMDTVVAVTGMTIPEIREEIKQKRLSIYMGQYRDCVTKESLSKWLKENDVRRTNIWEIDDDFPLSKLALVRLSGLNMNVVERFFYLHRYEVLRIKSQFSGSKTGMIKAGIVKKSDFVRYCCPESVKSDESDQAVNPDLIPPPLPTKPADQQSVETPCKKHSADIVSKMLDELQERGIRLVLTGDESMMLVGDQKLIVHALASINGRKREIYERILDNPKNVVSITAGYYQELKSRGSIGFKVF